MPGLLRGVARTAVVAGTASAVAGRVQRRQASKFAEKDAQTAATREQAYEQQVYQQQPPPQYQQAPPQYQQAPPPPAAPSQEEVIDQLRKLGELRDEGILTDEEFAAQKAKLLG